MPAIVVSKLVPPARADSHLPREHLVDSMLDARGARLVLIRAPAGFGKTTLMQQYAAMRQARGHATAWMRLDSADNDLPRFLSHLDAGLQPLAPDVSHRPASAQRLATSVIATVASLNTPFAILLDDFESIQSESVLNFIQLLLESLPPNGTLVVASRTTPPLGLGRIRARGHLLELQPGALRFTLSEATAFIREKCGIPLGDADVSRLHRYTEGWATAIFLATLSLRQRTDHARFVASFSGSNTELADYLAEDILGGQSAAVRHFLLDTSILSQLSAPLCNAMLGRTDSQAMLAALERDNLFLFPLNGEHDEYRYHSLFASFLQHRLHKLDPARETQLHAAAARWYLEAGRPVPAIDHLLRAGLHQEALAQMAPHADALLNNGRVRLLSRWFDLVRDKLPDADPRVRISAAWALLLNRRFDEAMATVQRILDDTEADVAREAVMLQAEALRCVLFAMTDQIDACRRVGLPVLDRLPPDDSFQYWMLTNSVAYGLLSARRHDEARKVLANACAGGRSDGVALLRSVADCLESIIDLIHGRLSRSIARLRTTQQTWHERPDAVDGGRAAAGVIFGLLLYESDQIDETARFVNDTLPFAKMTGPVDSMTTCHILSARVALLRGDRDLWQRRLHELEELGRQVQAPRAICSAWLERARVATIDGALDAAAQSLEAAQEHGAWELLDDAGYGNEVDRPAVARWRLQIARGADHAVCQALADAIATASAQQRLWRLAKLRVLHAMALDSLGQDHAALDALTEALRLSSHEGLVRTFLDEGPALTPLLGRWLAAQRNGMAAPGVAPGFVPSLLARAGVPVEAPVASAHAPSPGSPSSIDSALDALTARELDVLRMLSHGHRNRAIAERLFVSELTVKSHLRRISAKLGAQSRTEVVAIARTKGLLD